jgi:uncharacterized delta-60 repeat protein
MTGGPGLASAAVVVVRARHALLMLLAACAFEPPNADIPAASMPVEPDIQFEPKPTVELAFGESGLVVLRDPTASQQARAIAVLPDGGAVVSMLVLRESGVDSAVVRLSNAGAPLWSSLHETEGDDFFEALAVDPEGAIYAAGATVYSDARAVVPIVKLRAGGEVDPSFGDGGQALLPGIVESCASESRAYQVAFGASFDAEMRLLVSGNATEEGCVDRDMLVARLDRTTGELDPSFGSAGVVSARAPGFEDDQSDNGQDVIALPDGRVAIVGNTNRTSSFETARAVLWIQAEDGSEEMAGVFDDLDGSGSGSDSFHAVAADSAGRLVAAGRSYNGRDYDAVVMRFAADGAIDSSFGRAGVFVHGASGDDRARAVAIDSADRIWIAGYAANGEEQDLAVWRLTSDGAPDPTWGEGGLFTRDLGGDERAEAIAIDPLDRVFVAGTTSGSGENDEVLVLRLD